MTDPQNDVPCRDCKRPTQHATEICADCRTPAGRLVTALRERGIKAEASDDTDGVIVDGLFVDAVDCGWGISSKGDDLDGNIEAAANALAAIVQAPGLRAETDARIADAVAAERHAIGAWLRTSVRSAPFASAIEHGDHIDDDAPPLPSLRMVMLARDELLRQVGALTAELDRRIEVER